MYCLPIILKKTFIFIARQYMSVMFISLIAEIPGIAR